jgi:hypothetical protein
MKKRTVNAAFIIKTHTRMAKSSHREVMIAKRYKDTAGERMSRSFRDEHLAVAREVKRLAAIESLWEAI